jgi:CHAT domain-containing protein
MTGSLCLITALAAFSAGAQSPAELLSQADHLSNSFSLSKAQPLYHQAEAAFHLSGDSLNELNAKFGILRYNVQLGHYTVTREELERILASPLAAEDAHLRIRALEILGTIDLNQNVQAAFIDWTTLLATAKEAGDAKWVNRANGHLGIVAAMNGDMGGAGKALFQAIAKAEELGDVTGQLTFSMWLANGMSTNGMADNALRILERGELLAKKNGYTQMPIQFSIAKIRALSASKSEQDHASAKALLQTTLADARREGILGAQTDLLSQSGRIALAAGDYAAAEKSFTEQVQVAKQAALPSMQADGLLYLSQTFRAQHKADAAELAINQGISAEHGVQESYDLPRFVAEKAEVQLQLGHPKTADALYEQSISLVEGLLVNAPSSRVKSAMIGNLSEIYLGRFRLAWNKLHDAPEAFRVIESVRGRALVDTLSSPEQLDARTHKVPAEDQIARLQKTLLHTSMDANGTRRVLAQLDRAYDNAYPAEYEQNRKEVGLLHHQPVSLDALRRQLKPGETFVEYVLDAKSSYAMEITSSGLTVHSLPSRSAIDQLAKTFLGAINSKTDSSTAAKALYAAIISPIINPLDTSLIIVPDGSLNSVPFGALIDAKGAYLNQTIAVTAAPSATVYFALKTALPSKTTVKPFLGIAYSPPQTKEPLLASNTRGVFDLRGAHLSPLPFAREEIVTAGKTLGAGAVVLDGDLASETDLKAQPLRDFKVIHLAAHAVGNEMEPDRAALVFAAGNGDDDGLWQAREIRRTRLNADVIVLSACETGVGRLQGEEGVMNLSRAFLTAGAKSVVASLWSVEDRSTATLMESFYQHLAAGLTVSEALRHAQLDFIKDYGEKAQPYLWAGFVVVGDGTRKINVATNKTITRSTR